MDNKIIYVYGKRVGSLNLVCYELSEFGRVFSSATCAPERAAVIVQMMMQEGYSPKLGTTPTGEEKPLLRGTRKQLEKLIKK